MNQRSSGLVEAALETWISSAAPGARLPSTRELTAHHGVSPVTVQAALRSLVCRGLIETRPGAGTFVSATRELRPVDLSWQTATLGAAGAVPAAASSALRTVRSDAISLHSGYPDRGLLPERLLRPAIARAGRGDAALERTGSAGLAGLRAWFAAEIAAQTPADVTGPSARDVIIVPGSQLGLAVLFRSIAGPGGAILIESPTYWGAILAAGQVGTALVPVPASTEGPDVSALERAFTETGARGFYAQPNFANPTGARWSAARAAHVLEIVRAHGAFLIEDDWAHDFGITADPVPVVTRDDSGHVVYLRSLTKSVSPAIRVAALVARGPLHHRLLTELQPQSMYVSGLLQAAALDVVTQPAWRSHRRALRKQLRARRDLLVAALTTHTSDATIEGIPAGGLSLWVRLPYGTDLARLTQEAELRGLAVAAGNEWFPAEPTAPYVRLSFAGPNPDAFDQAAIILGEVLAQQR
ncbi:PLP-dependent aminotransferase family protein [Pseudonocardia sp. HH130629-09]|uniref:aminotransferase-like domain-containing protein n=1 Tax=Pseudonocardia sp. HH130629-09 TaxID=1641402 RepID=UPI0006CB2682|nr:PLP-dependent aminotransferase family protein [Pseudonocardia sp. HH130629-09]ALE83696.1 GntR family transcriptional regulator [Pseudonocardia sp. HH130629-09]